MGQWPALKAKNHAETEEKKHRGKKQYKIIGQEKTEILFAEPVEAFPNKEDKVEERSEDKSGIVEFVWTFKDCKVDDAIGNKNWQGSQPDFVSMNQSKEQQKPQRMVEQVVATVNQADVDALVEEYDTEQLAKQTNGKQGQEELVDFVAAVVGKQHH